MSFYACSGTKPSDKEIKKAITEEITKSMKFIRTDLKIKIKKVGNYGKKGNYYPVYADVGFDVPTSYLGVDVDYFKLFKNSSGKWKAERVVKKEQ